MAKQPTKLAVLISGSGSTMDNLAARIDAGGINATIDLVLASNTRAKGIAIARDRGLPHEVVSRSSFANRNEFSEEIFRQIEAVGVDYVCLAGFLSLLRIPDAYAQRVINIHPALLPSFGGPGMYGRHVHEAVLHHGSKVSGCTVHFADQSYDTGPILVQRSCEVREDDTPDTLSERVVALEKEAYPDAIAMLADGRVQIEGKRTRIA